MARFMELWQSSLDDGTAFIIRCPMRLSPFEFEHVKEFAALALRTLERNVNHEQSPCVGIESGPPETEAKETK